VEVLLLDWQRNADAQYSGAACSAKGESWEAERIHKAKAMAFENCIYELRQALAAQTPVAAVDYKALLEDMIDRYNHLSGEHIKALSSVPVDEWRDIAVEKPPISDWVIVHGNCIPSGCGALPIMACWLVNHFVDYNGKEITHLAITHWRPLPAPPAQTTQQKGRCDGY
jgi:hypothetical protein